MRRIVVLWKSLTTQYPEQMIASNSMRYAWISWYLHRHKEKCCEHSTSCCMGEGWGWEREGQRNTRNRTAQNVFCRASSQDYKPPANKFTNWHTSRAASLTSQLFHLAWRAHFTGKLFCLWRKLWMVSTILFFFLNSLLGSQLLCLDRFPLLAKKRN